MKVRIKLHREESQSGSTLLKNIDINKQLLIPTTHVKIKKPKFIPSGDAENNRYKSFDYSNHNEECRHKSQSSLSFKSKKESKYTTSWSNTQAKYRKGASLYNSQKFKKFFQSIDVKRYQQRTRAEMQKTVNLENKLPQLKVEEQYFSFMNTKNRILVEATSSQEEAMTILDHMQRDTSSPGYSGSVVFDQAKCNIFETKSNLQRRNIVDFTPNMTFSGPLERSYQAERNDTKEDDTNSDNKMTLQKAINISNSTTQTVPQWKQSMAQLVQAQTVQNHSPSNSFYIVPQTEYKMNGLVIDKARIVSRDDFSRKLTKQVQTQEQLESTPSINKEPAQEETKSRPIANQADQSHIEKSSASRPNEIDQLDAVMKHKPYKLQLSNDNDGSISTQYDLEQSQEPPMIVQQMVENAPKKMKKKNQGYKYQLRLSGELPSGSIHFAQHSQLQLSTYDFSGCNLKSNPQGLKSKEVFRNHVKKMVATRQSRLQNMDSTLSLESRSVAVSQKESAENEVPSLNVRRSQNRQKKVRGPLQSVNGTENSKVIRIPRDRTTAVETDQSYLDDFTVREQVFPIKHSLNADLEDDALDVIINDDTISGRVFEPVMHTISSHDTNIGEPIFETKQNNNQTKDTEMVLKTTSQKSLLNIKLGSPLNASFDVQPQSNQPTDSQGIKTLEANAPSSSQYFRQSSALSNEESSVMLPKNLNSSDKDTGTQGTVDQKIGVQIDQDKQYSVEPVKFTSVNPHLMGSRRVEVAVSKSQQFIKKPCSHAAFISLNQKRPYLAGKNKYVNSVVELKRAYRDFKNKKEAILLKNRLLYSQSVVTNNNSKDNTLLSRNTSKIISKFSLDSDTVTRQVDQAESDYVDLETSKVNVESHASLTTILPQVLKNEGRFNLPRIDTRHSNILINIENQMQKKEDEGFKIASMTLQDRSSARGSQSSLRSSKGSIERPFYVSDYRMNTINH